MIIRRKHTANYTTIGNELFNDERLAADEVGILAFLLSRPNDWEVRRPALMRRWNVGRDAMKRIMTNWMKTGWCRAEKTRLANGTFHIVYEIRDQPGPTLSEEEVRRALSLVSSEAAEDRSDDSHGSAGGPDHPPPTDPPPTGQPGVADQRAAGRIWPIEDSLNTDSQNDDGGVARASVLTDQCFEIARAVGKLCGYPEPVDWPAKWQSAHYRVQTWLTAGWSRENIVAAVTETMAGKRDGPPSSINYFDKPIAQFIARRNAPLPQSQPNEVHRVQTNRGPSQSSIPRGGFASFARDRAKSSG